MYCGYHVKEFLVFKKYRLKYSEVKCLMSVTYSQIVLEKKMCMWMCISDMHLNIWMKDWESINVGKC